MALGAGFEWMDRSNENRRGRRGDGNSLKAPEPSAPSAVVILRCLLVLSVEPENRGDGFGVVNFAAQHQSHCCRERQEALGDYFVGFGLGKAAAQPLGPRPARRSLAGRVRMPGTGPTFLWRHRRKRVEQLGRKVFL